MFLLVDGMRRAKDRAVHPPIPMKIQLRRLLLISGLLAGATGLFAEPPATTPNPNASDNAKAILKMLQDFKTQREQYIADRKALIAKLQGATEAERKQIIEQLRADQQARIEAQRELAKAIRDAAKQQRDQHKGG